ncbi:MAG: nitrous oxide reductase accessory protein NosL, partial [Burkholderiales bacterium]
GKATDWDKPEAGAWVDARAAWFVIDSAVHGGMGAPEAVPFSDEATADAFREKRGGKVVRLGEIADSYVLGPVDLAPPPSHQNHVAQDQEAGQPVSPGGAMKSHQ